MEAEFSHALEDEINYVLYIIMENYSNVFFFAEIPILRPNHYNKQNDDKRRVQNQFGRFDRDESSSISHHYT